MAIENTTPKRFTATNPVTGDLIKSRANNQDVYAENLDKIFGKKPSKLNPRDYEDSDRLVDCSVCCKPFNGNEQTQKCGLCNI